MLSHSSIQISYFAAGIVSHLACLPDDVWVSALLYNKSDFIRVLVSSLGEEEEGGVFSFLFSFFANWVYGGVGAPKTLKNINKSVHRVLFTFLRVSSLLFCSKKGEAVCKWTPPQNEMVAYRSFHPFQTLILDPNSRLEIHLWAVWAIHHILTKKSALILKGKKSFCVC